MKNFLGKIDMKEVLLMNNRSCGSKEEKIVKKIVIIAPVLEQRVLKMIKSFISLEYEVAVIYSKISKVVVESLNSLNHLKMYKYEAIINPSIVDYKAKKQIKDILTDIENAEVFVIRDIFLFYFLRKIIRKNFSNVKLFVDVADNFDLLGNYLYKIYDPRRYVFNMLTKHAFKSLNEFTDGIYVVCENNKERLVKTYRVNASKIYTIENAAMKNEFKSPHKIKSFNYDYSIVYAGLMDNRIRNFEELLKALSIIKQWKLFIYPTSWKGFTENDFKGLVKKYRLETRVTIYPSVPFEKYLSEISKYSFGIIPHFNIPPVQYTLPNKIYDYIVAGIPIITSNVDILRKFVEENKIGFAYENYYNLASQLMNLSFEKYKLLKSNTLEASAFYTWEYKSLNMLKKSVLNS